MKSMEKSIVGRLYEYQKNHAMRLINIIKNNNAALDASDTGTGKTYAAVAVCKHLKLRPIIICPKSVISTWREVTKEFKVLPEFIVNYETLQRGKYYSVSGDRILCPYIDVKGVKGKEYKFIPSKSNIFIFDEVHRCAGKHTYNAQMLLAAKRTKKPILMLSATIADRAQRFMVFFYILNFLDPEQHTKYAEYMYRMDQWVNRDAKPMVRIHHMLYPDRASRIRIDDLGDKFPETQITATSYYMGKTKSDAIEKEYRLISEEIDSLQDKEKKDKKNFLVKLLRAHQKIELLKVATIVELVNDFLENNYSVVIFVNFTQTLNVLSNMLKTRCIIYGKQTLEVRERNIKEFMNNKQKIIVCNIKAGGVGISLHDKYGGHPRAAILSPTWNSIDLVQALGRVHRAGGKSKSLQRIIYAAKTIEENIARKIKIKLKNLSSVNNGDLDLTNIKFKDVY
jgi:superfamily II DNA or RNA helicase